MKLNYNPSQCVSNWVRKVEKNRDRFPVTISRPESPHREPSSHPEPPGKLKRSQTISVSPYFVSPRFSIFPKLLTESEDICSLPINITVNDVDRRCINSCLAPDYTCMNRLVSYTVLFIRLTAHGCLWLWCSLLSLIHITFDILLLTALSLIGLDHHRHHTAPPVLRSPLPLSVGVAPR